MDAKFFDPNRQEDDFQIEIDYDGQWYHRGSPITRHRLSELFSTALHYNEAKNEYWLVTPHEQGRVKVTDAPYIVTDFNWDVDAGTLELKTNLNHVVTPDGRHTITITNNVPYCLIKNSVRARINRSVREKLIDIALKQNGYDDATGELILNANGFDHVIARS